MKKSISFFTVFFFSFLLFAEEFKILSFNMGSRNKTALQVAQMIQESGADFVFLQEIWVSAPKDEALQKMCAHLGKSDWDFISSSSYLLRDMQTIDGETYKTGGNGQNNAIIYNKSKLSVKNLSEQLGFTHFGKVQHAFLFDKNNVVVVELSPKNKPEQSCVAIDIHLPYNDKEHRARDLATLERLYARYKLKGAVIAAGDFNYNRRDLTKRNFDFVDGTERWFSDPNFGICTTLSTKGESSVQFSNDYDHFIFNKKIKVVEQMHRAFTDSADSESIRMVSEAIMFGTDIYKNSIDFRKAISDHVPIMMSVEILE
ncbi:MAG: endonuclease/exonuclease/phosphatase family protein [Treponema sp.]|nr:endonuclease/exonuclease/phosphatase family protein [Treponema sp.]